MMKTRRIWYINPSPVLPFAMLWQWRYPVEPVSVSDSTELRKQQYERFKELFALGGNATWCWGDPQHRPVVEKDDYLTESERQEFFALGKLSGFYVKDGYAVVIVKYLMTHPYAQGASEIGSLNWAGLPHMTLGSPIRRIVKSIDGWT